eukprot:scaffold5203_cov60-Phaeocystis_antarctica.AAC.2
MYGKVLAESNAMRRGIRGRDSPTCVVMERSPMKCDFAQDVWVSTPPGAGLAPGFTIRRGASVHRMHPN